MAVKQRAQTFAIIPRELDEVLELRRDIRFVELPLPNSRDSFNIRIISDDAAHIIGNELLLFSQAVHDCFLACLHRCLVVVAHFRMRIDGALVEFRDRRFL